MKARSPAFARIQADVLAIVRSVPPGALVTFADVGGHLDVMPRHVAYILAMLAPAEQLGTPWHRAVPENGRLRRGAGDALGASQADLLRAEGVAVTAAGVIANLAAHRCPVGGLPHGVPVQRRQDRPTGG
ncbi:MGMT family protein [Novosphingobium flavum]|uniref:MGMT family protein n=1 Tax=Novosphingobium aerophilum TaxID=2839843 RepID=A0A7X1KDT2_9SPHN|nr:MGMT family protein [Novosphingobium aerophilum]MBC2653690.1 MGMT family protein [Novosphingobium aerophilum]MBC2663793.1 MGMT family protein [Novosphingobium aerophilum]